MIKRSKLILAIAFFLSIFNLAHAQGGDLLSPEERLWLDSRNNTIVAYPEKNNPPFSYTSAGGNIQGLAIDYVELIAEKIDAKVEYLVPQSKNQIINDFSAGKGDIVAGLMDISSRSSSFIFTDSYVTVPTVIVVRKDFPEKGSLTLNDFNGKKVSLVAGSALEEYVRENYPRVVLEDVTDDEVSLQQIILGEVDGGVMDIASLSFYLSKQILSSVKVAGNTGLDYKPAFALRKDMTVLQSILEKAMTQISVSDRELLTEKWVSMPFEEARGGALSGFLERNSSAITLYVLGGLVSFVATILFLRHRRIEGLHYKMHNEHGVGELKEELNELEKTNAMLLREIEAVKREEDRLQHKIEEFGK